MKRHIQTETEWEMEKAIEIIDFVRGELYLDLPYMGIALGGLESAPKEELQTFATDGTYLFFQSGQVLRLFKQNTLFLERAYLHSILHCIFSHLWIGGERNRILWGTACDIAVEYTIDRMDKPSVKRALSWIRMQTYEQIEKELYGISAATIYYWLEEAGEEKRRSLMQEFYTDDHRFWPKEERTSARTSDAARQKWNKIAKQSQMEQKRHGLDKSAGQEILAAQLAAGKSQRSYKEFLQKFSVLREELRQDPDEFDLNYYMYGLQTYGNMPLLEPLETRESKKIQEFVIVVDTSYSTSGQLIQNFLTETFAILKAADSFFKESRVRIIQCDDQVRMDEEVRSEREIETLMSRFTVVGGGGTDFRPAFSYVNRLLEDGQLKNLSGLLYFTDGKGTYPAKRPDYRTAFLFLEDYDEERVPAWAIRMRLAPEEFGGSK